ncbi:MAG TPA: hypothetical protein VFD92_27860 [Candidatus Binatia bacterium]|nr:hypothetical protein [Candidatus Binatia bacterium]
MTRALRLRHRRVVALLAIALPAAVVAAVAARPAPPVQGRDPVGEPPAEPSASVAAGAPAAVASAGEGPLRLAARVVPADARAPEPSPARLEVDVRGDVAQPELLAYWAPVAPGAIVPRDRDLPAGSVLLGPARIGGARTFALPDAAGRQAGEVIVYSLAHGRVAAAVALPTRAPLDAAATGSR